MPGGKKQIKSQAQSRFMRACAHSPSHMDGQCPSPTVIKEFIGHHQKTKHLPERVKKP